MFTTFLDVLLDSKIDNSCPRRPWRKSSGSYNQACERQRWLGTARVNFWRVYHTWPKWLLSVVRWLAQQIREEQCMLLTLTRARPLTLSQSSLVTILGKCELNGWTTKWAGKIGRIFGLKVIQHLCVAGYFFVGCFLLWWTVTNPWGSLLGLILFIICPSVTWIGGQRTEYTVSKVGGGVGSKNQGKWLIHWKEGWGLLIRGTSRVWRDEVTETSTAAKTCLGQKEPHVAVRGEGWLAT